MRVCNSEEVESNFCLSTLCCPDTYRCFLNRMAAYLERQNCSRACHSSEGVFSVICSQLKVIENCQKSTSHLIAFSTWLPFKTSPDLNFSIVSDGNPVASRARRRNPPKGQRPHLSSNPIGHPPTVMRLMIKKPFTCLTNNSCEYSHEIIIRTQELSSFEQDHICQLLIWRSPHNVQMYRILV